MIPTRLDSADAATVEPEHRGTRVTGESAGGWWA
jgi:hypothetical protein